MPGLRKYNILSEQYVTEWLAMKYPVGTWQTNVQLGELDTSQYFVQPTDSEIAATKPWLPECDALVILPDEVHIIEAKIRDDRGKVEQLLLYGFLFKRTQRFRQHWNKPVKLILLTPMQQGNLEKWLNSLGITVAYYTPAWLLDYLGKLPKRQLRAAGSAIKL